jgi:hypothetical protein
MPDPCIECRLPLLKKKKKQTPAKDAGVLTDAQKKAAEAEASTVGLTDFLKSAIGNPEKTKQLQQALFKMLVNIAVLLMESLGQMF